MGGIVYYAIIFSCFPLCSLHDVDLTAAKGCFAMLAQLAWDVTKEIAEESYVSLAVLLFAFVGSYLSTNQHMGGVARRLLVALLHWCAHYLAALSTFIFAESLVVAITELHLDFAGSTWDTFKTYFVASYARIEWFDAHICGDYGIFIKCAEVIVNAVDVCGFHVSLRNEMCNADAGTLSRLNRFVYHCTSFVYYFMLAAPMSSVVLGMYLFVSLNYFGKYDEGFSSLRLETYKNVLRFKLDRRGKMTCYVLGMDDVPKRWRLDPKWSGKAEKDRESYAWEYPSKYVAFYSNSRHVNTDKEFEFRKVRLVDTFTIE